MTADQDPPPIGPTTRTTIRRKRERGSYDRDVAYDILDEALIAHVGFVVDHRPVVLPMTYARIGDNLYLHGAAANAMLRNLVDASDVCVTVTLLDGLVFARSAFHHSMNYRSVVLCGTASRVIDTEEMRAVSAALLEHLATGRSADARPPTDSELRSTLMVRLPIAEGSVKVRTGGPIDDPEDLGLPVWAGVIPIALVSGPPQPDAAL